MSVISLTSSSRLPWNEHLPCCYPAKTKNPFRKSGLRFFDKTILAVMINIIFLGREGTGVPLLLKFFCCFVDETMVGACARRRVTFMYSCQRVFIDQFIFRTILIFNLEYLLTSTNQSVKLRDLKIVFWTLYVCFYSIWHIKPRADGRNIVGWYILRPFANPLDVIECCCVLLWVVCQTFETGQTLS